MRKDANVLDSHIAGVANLVWREYPIGDTDMTMVLQDIESIRSAPASSAAGMTSKRAMMLLAIYLEDAVALHLAEPTSNGVVSFTEDMSARVLPVLAPELLRTLCQRPDHFVRIAAVLHTMWGGESLQLFESGEE
jgi:hypothetical protein